MRTVRRKRCRFVDQVSSNLSEDHDLAPEAPLSQEEVVKNIMKSLKSEPLESELIGRKKEFDEIKNYIVECVEFKRSGIIYISGSPGTGKTCTVDKVLNELKNIFLKKKMNKLDNYEIVRTNASKMVSYLTNNSKSLTNISLFVELFNLMKFSQSCIEKFKKVCKQQSYSDIIDYFIRELINKKTKFVVFIDEIDLINNKNNFSVIIQLIRAIIDHPECRTILIAVANTVQIGNNVIKRLGIDVKTDFRIKLVVFPPYDHNTLRKIVMQRIEHVCKDDKFINKAGIELCVRKIANLYGDCRRTLDVCHLTIGKFFIENRQVDIQNALNGELNIEHEDLSDECNSTAISTRENTPILNRFTHSNSDVDLPLSLRTRSLPANITFGNFQKIIGNIHHSNQTKTSIIHALPLHQQYAIMGIVLAIVDENLKSQEDKEVVNNKLINFSSDKLINIRISTTQARSKYNYICKELLTAPEEYKDMLDALESNNIITTVNELGVVRRRSSSFHRTKNIRKESMIELILTPEQVVNALITHPKLGNIFSNFLPNLEKEKLDN